MIPLAGMNAANQRQAVALNQPQGELMLTEIIDRQREEIRAHRAKLGLGEYTALKGTEVLYDRTVTYHDDQGQKITRENVTIHVGERMAVLWLQNWPNPKAINRRLGTFEVHQ